MSEGYVFKIGGSIADYASELAKIPGVTDKAAATAALKMGAQFARMEADAAKKAKGAAKEVGNAFGAATDGVGKDLSDLAKNVAKVSGFGELGEKVGALGEAFAVVVSPAGLAAAAVGGFAIAAAGAVAGSAALVVGLGQTVLASDEALARLEQFKAIGSDFFPAIPPDRLQAIKDANASLDALASIGDHLTVAIGSNVAPAFAEAGKAAAGLALAASQVFEGFIKGQSIVHALAVGVGAGLSYALTLPLEPMAILKDAMGDLIRLSGKEVPAALQGNELALIRLNAANGESLASAVDSAFAYSGLGGVWDGLVGKGGAIIATQEKATAAQKGSANAAKGAAEAQKKAAASYASDLSEEEKAQQAFGAGIASLAAETKKASDAQLSGLAAVKQARVDDLAALQATYQATLAQAGGDQQRLMAIQAYEAAKFQIVAEYEGKITAAQAAEEAIRVKAAQDATAKQSADVNAYAQAASSTLSTLSGSFGQLLQSIDPKGHEEAYMAIWAAQKAAAIASAAVNAALAVSYALGSAPPPANFVLAAAAGVAGAINVGTIAASPPPKFHAGTMFASPSGGMAPDEFAATLQRGEIVVDRQTASRPGVREQVAALSTGGSAGRSTHPDDVAEGMDRSSVPMLLQALLSEMRRGNNRAPSPTPGRPGHRPSYGY